MSPLSEAKGLPRTEILHSVQDDSEGFRMTKDLCSIVDEQGEVQAVGKTEFSKYGS